MFDGFDDDFVLPDRKPRPCYYSLDRLQQAVLEHDFVATGENLRATTAAVYADASFQSVWGKLCLEVAQLAHNVASGEYVTALRKSDIARQLLREVEAGELVDGALQTSHSLVEIAALLRKRATRIAVHGEGDPLVDSPGSLDTLSSYRAAAMVFAGAAALNLFVQDNYTGPELPTPEVVAASAAERGTIQKSEEGAEDDMSALAALCPVPFMRTLLSIDVNVSSDGGSSEVVSTFAVGSRWKSVNPSQLERTQWGQERESAAAASVATAIAAEAASLEVVSDSTTGSSAPKVAPPAVDAAEGAAETSIDDAPGGGVEALLQRPRSSLQLASLAALAMVDADEPFEHMGHPHFLVVARAIFNALLPTPLALSSTGAASTSSSGSAATTTMTTLSESDVRSMRENRLHTALFGSTRRLFSAHWWAGRAASIHHRALIGDRSKRTSPLLWRLCVASYKGAAGSVCPDYALAFTDVDVFQRDIVRREIADTVLRGASEAQRRRDGGNGEGEEEGVGATSIWEGANGGAADVDGAAAATAAIGPQLQSSHSNAIGGGDSVPQGPSSQQQQQLAEGGGGADARFPRRLVARLLLEWGHAQHFFSRTAAAKTSFFLAKRETGLATMLTGALGRKTKFQTFDTSQLVLRACSQHGEAACALVDAAAAEQFGAAPGRFSAAAMRKMTATVDAETGAAPLLQPPSQYQQQGQQLQLLPPVDPATALLPLGVEVEGAPLSVKVEGGALPPPPPPSECVLLGGVRAITLDEADSDNIRLETIALRPAALDGVVTAEDAVHEEESRGRLGWGRELESRLRTAAAAAAAVDTSSVVGVAKASAPSSHAIGSPSSTTLTTASTDAGAAAAAAVVSAGSVPVVVPDDGPVVDGPLSSLDQCTVLALCLDVSNHNPADGLTAEEMKPYLERVLDTPLNWMTHSTCLLVRSWLEFEGGRTPERAALQMQALLDQHTARLTPMQPRPSSLTAGSAAPAAVRMSFVYSLVFPPRWDLKRQVADRYRSMGVLRSALELYEGLEAWEQIIEVHVLLERNARAERLLRRRLALYPSPRLWCLLGLVTDDDAHFVTAWETSKHTYAKAQIAMAKRAAAKGDQAIALSHLRTGLALSPNNEDEWFLMGVLCMQSSDMGGAIDAFSRVVQLNATRASAWANLGSIYLQQKDWGRGYTALEQALRQDRKDWRMWSNFLAAAVRTRNYGRAISVMHTLLDLRRGEHSGGIAGGGSGLGGDGQRAQQRGGGRKAGPGGVSTEESGLDLPALTVVTQAVVASATAAAAAAVAAAAPSTTAAAAAAAAGTAAAVGAVDSVMPWEAATTAATAAVPTGLLPLMPTSMDIDDDDGGGPAAEKVNGGAVVAAAGAAALQLQQQEDADGNPARVYIDALAKLFGHITSVITREPRVWAMYAALHTARGKHADALDCRLRACRALQATSGWEKDPDAIDAVCIASTALVRDYLSMSTSSPSHLLSARMHLTSLLGRVGGGAQAAHAALEGIRALLRRVEGMEAAAASASKK